MWRLPLVAFVFVGLACLQYLDHTIARANVSEAATQAVQTGALLESFVAHRVAHLRNLATLVGDAETGEEEQRRFAILAREIAATSPDVLAIVLLDSMGVVHSVHSTKPVSATPADRDRRPDPFGAILDAGEHGAAERASALRQSRATEAPAVTGSVRLRDGGRGVLMYQPVVRDDRLVGYVGGAFAYQSLFADVLAGPLQGDFAYRIVDDAGNVIAIASDFPSRVSHMLRRDVRLPADRNWTLEVAIPPFRPAVPRLVTWLVGLLLLALVVLLVVREAARAERLAAHSDNLELLSRDLLDANVRIEERAQQVTEANRAKSRFLANVSHELRTPLNAIVGYNALALDGIYGALSSPLRAAHERIREAGGHLLALVDDVLDLSKIEVGRMGVAPEPVDVRTTLDAVVTVIEPVAAAKGVALGITSAPDLPRMVTDPRHLRQILLNLAANAVKFTEQGTVTLSARRDEARPDSHVAVTVEDTGIGIAPDDLTRIFDEFEQVRPGGRGDSLQRGTGLGLAISRKLARLLGGDVRVESHMGAGSRFTVTLPYMAPRIAVARATPVYGHPALPTEVERGIPHTREVAVPEEDPVGEARVDPRSDIPAHASDAAPHGGISGLDDNARPG